MILAETLQARRDQLVIQRDEMIAAEEAEHERMIGQINACAGAIQLCEMLLAELDAAEPRPALAAVAAD